MNLCDANYIEILTDKIKHLEGDIKALLKDNTSLREEITSLKHKSDGDEKLLKTFADQLKTANTCRIAMELEILKFNGENFKINRENEKLRGELEIAIKGQKEFKRIINDLEAINKEYHGELIEYERDYNNLKDVLHERDDKIEELEEYVTYSKYLESKIDVLEDRLSPTIGGLPVHQDDEDEDEDERY